MDQAQTPSNQRAPDQGELNLEHNHVITSAPEALTMALFLAITAPTDQKSAEAAAIADSLAAGLSPEVVEACKLAAQEQAFGCDAVVH